MSLPHQPVLYQEIIHALRPKSTGFYVDGTLGAGGHAAGLLAGSEPGGRLLGLDVDPQALELARQNLAPFGERACLIRAPYTSLPDQLAALGWDKVDGILLDLGASSMQFDTPERGFSFLADGPLDMRFDPSNPLTAAEIVNTWPEDELADVLFRYGEERASRRIAQAIQRARPISGTRQLADVIEKAIGRHGRPPPRHADLPGPADRRQRRTGSAGENPAAGSAGPGSGRKTGGHQLPLAGGSAGQRVLPPGKQGLHLPTQTTGLHLRT